MFSFLKDLFKGADDARRRESEADKQTRKLEMDEPMAAAGAQLDGERKRSETEEIARRGD